jgi:hypothetical protein
MGNFLAFLPRVKHVSMRLHPSQGIASTIHSSITQIRPIRINPRDLGGNPGNRHHEVPNDG